VPCGDEVGTITGVTDVDADLASGRLTVNSDRPIDREAVVAAVDEAGYAVSPRNPAVKVAGYSRAQR